MPKNISFDSSTTTQRTVKEMLPDEQPREKLVNYGSESLSNSELLAILLRSGSGKMNVLDMSRSVLEHFNGLRNLYRRTWKELTVIPGIARVKALTLEAAFELSRRIEVADLGDTISIRCPEDAQAFFGPKLRDLKQEVFMLGFLNAAKILTGHRKISSGGSTSTIVDVAEVMRQAILSDANSIIVLHNHPSGNPNASKADINLTHRIAKAGEMMGIPVDDHLIIAGNRYTSLRAEGYMK